MNLPRPEDRLAECLWLPRILAKARAFQAGTLAPEYLVPFGHPAGVDGQFLKHFSLTKEQIIEVSKLSDAEVVTWFSHLPAVTAESLAAWNHIAINLGRPGFPMAERFPVALQTSYKHLAGRGLSTVFEALNADEGFL